MTDWLPEVLLEMHFHRDLIDYYARSYGAQFLRLYKPVPQKEAWVGFDQGWTRSDLTEEQLFDSLRSAIGQRRTSISKFYLGEFLQFKVVNIVSKRSDRMPPGYVTPYYRSTLSLKPNKTTNISQHETLLRLSAIANATVLYACGMVFSQDEIWQPPDLSKLRFVDITLAPIGWATNESHYITFQAPNDASPFWCSEPTPALAYGIEQRGDHNALPHRLSGEEMILLIASSAEAISSQSEDDQLALLNGGDRYTRFLPECFSLMEFESV